MKPPSTPPKEVCNCDQALAAEAEVVRLRALLVEMVEKLAPVLQVRERAKRVLR